jgi:hypothetical protein
MVNKEFRCAEIVPPAACRTADCREKSADFSVNQFLSKRFEFFESFPPIRIECAQSGQPALQACLLAFRLWR